MTAIGGAIQTCDLEVVAADEGQLAPQLDPPLGDDLEGADHDLVRVRNQRGRRVGQVEHLARGAGAMLNGNTPLPADQRVG